MTTQPATDTAIPTVKEFYLGVAANDADGGGRKSFRDVKSYRRRKRWLA